LLAARVLEIEERIVSGAYQDVDSFERLALVFHHEMVGALVPDWAGQWRRVQVAVGAHMPPPPHEVPMLMRRYAGDMTTRLAFVGESEKQLLETLAFAEGRFLSIHPFFDFNGRTMRLLLRELLRRLELPPLKLTPEPGTHEELHYLDALRAADHLDWTPLALVWQKRFGTFQLL
jgi:CRISPR-associated endonuclease/helicase Cas3